MERSHVSADEPTMVEILSAEPELTSYGSNWQDINVESYCLPPSENAPQDIHHHILTINVGKTYEYESEFDDRYCRGRFVAGEVSLYPSRQPMPYRTLQDTSIIYLSLSEELLIRNCQEFLDRDRVELQVTHSTKDPLLQQLGLALRADLEAGSPGGEIYAQTMANAIAVQLLQNFSTQKPCNQDLNGRLSPYKLKRVLRYIDERLEKKIILEDLAAIAQLSQHHFARAFKQSTGLSPHQYIIQTRIERAKQLLTHSGMEINEVAIACGFSNQSHLHRHFKKHLGITPKQFYRNRQYFG